MARRALGPAALKVTQAVAAVLPAGPVVVGVSGGADSLALTLGAAQAAPMRDSQIRAVIVDHGLQDDSAEVSARVVEQLTARGIAAEVRRVRVGGAGGLEAAAREARLEALTRDGCPVLLGHSLDDQAETVLLGLLRGSGLRSISGMAPVRGQLIRPLLGLRRSELEQACRDWGLQWWADPMNRDPRFSRVRARSALALLSEQLGQDVAVNLARTAKLAAQDAQLLDELAADARAAATVAEETADAEGPALQVSALAGMPAALRSRVLLAWLREGGVPAERAHVAAVEQLVVAWRGQRGVDLPKGSVRRRAGVLWLSPRPEDRAGKQRPGS